MDTTPEKETLTETNTVTTEHVEETTTTTADTTGEATTSTSETPEETSPKKSFYKHKPLIVAIVVAVLLVGGAGGYYVYNTKYSKGPVVAIVNGKKIYQKEYDEGRTLIEQSAVAQGSDVSDDASKEEIKKQALEVLINNALITTAAEKEGITASDDAVKAKYDELVTQMKGEEALNKKMLEVGLTKEKLMKNIKERIVADEYIQAKTDIKSLKVTEDEVTAFVKDLEASSASSGQKLPPLDQIRKDVEDQILSQKQQQVIVDLLKKLKDEGKIEVKI